VEDDIGRTCNICGKDVNIHKIVSGNLEGRPRKRWENNIKMDLRELGSENVTWSHLA
jgi:hypothetical protein